MIMCRRTALQHWRTVRHGALVQCAGRRAPSGDGEYERVARCSWLDPLRGLGEYRPKLLPKPVAASFFRCQGAAARVRPAALRASAGRALQPQGGKTDTILVENPRKTRPATLLNKLFDMVTVSLTLHILHTTGHYTLLNQLTYTHPNAPKFTHPNGHRH